MGQKFIFIYLLFIQVIFVSAQSLTGFVTDSETKKPLAQVKVSIESSGNWALTDEEGKFSIKYNIGEIISFYKNDYFEKKTTLSSLSSINISLNPATVRIPEVKLSAKKEKYSEIEIEQEALRNIQAFSVKEILEQLPGQRITNLNLNEFKPIVFRSAEPTYVSNEAFGNKSFGTAIVVDGIPISNNENMQTFGGNYSSLYNGTQATDSFGIRSTFQFNGYTNNANYGADLREIPVENIEKIEVVQGIPSAKYGDLTSGLINIKQKAGESPYRFYVNLRQGTFEYNFNKGFKINDKLGAVNVNFNYLDSNNSPRTNFYRYKRYTTNIMWSWNNAKKNINNSLSVDYSFNGDDINDDEEDVESRIIYNKKKEISISDRFRWKFEDFFFDNLEVNFNYRRAKQNSYDSRLVNNGGSVVGTSYTEDVYTGAYTPVSYRAVKNVEGIPISTFFSADLRKNIEKNGWKHNLLLGTSFRFSDNKGQGRIGSPETLSNFFASTSGNGNIGFRPYNFGENVRAEYQASLYLEDNINKRWNNNIFNFNGGLRLDNQFGSTLLAPRINTYLIHEKWKFRAGFGLTSKAPSINQIYTGPRYFDAVLGDIRLPNYYNIGIVQTFIDYADNKDLKPSRSLRSEIGTDYRFPFGVLNLTAYYNKLYDGFVTSSYAAKRNLAELQINYNGTNTPTYDVIGYKDYYFLQNHTTNDLESVDKGLEMMLSVEKFPLKNVTFDFQGSYVETANTFSNEILRRSTDTTAEQVYGIYKSNGANYKQIIVGGAVNYHLPKAGLIITLRSQHFFMDDINNDKSITPIAYLDKNLNRVNLTESQINDASYLTNIRGLVSTDLDQKDRKVYHNINLKITKDFLNGFRFSFYANNFIDLKQTTYRWYNGQYIKLVNPDLLTLSFGAKIEYQF